MDKQQKPRHDPAPNAEDGMKRENDHVKLLPNEDKPNTNPRLNPCSGCCYCVLGGCPQPNPQPCAVRSLFCIAQAAFWYAGLFVQGNEPQTTDFNRGRWDRLTSAQEIQVPLVGLHTKDMLVVDHVFAPARSDPSAVPVPVRLYIPLKRDGRYPDNIPIMVYLHGGGWCIESNKGFGFDMLCRRYCRNARMLVVSVDYRLAPEHPFPHAVYDGYEVLSSIADRGRPEDSANAKQPCAQAVVDALSTADLSRVVLAGDSAGGNLACVLSSLVKDGLDAHLQPKRLSLTIAHQVLFYPVLFMSRPSRSSSDGFHVPLTDTKRGSNNKGFEFLHPNVGDFMVRAYITQNGGPLLPRSEARKLALQDRRLAPLLNGAQGLPPTSLIAAELDGLNVDIEAAYYALASSGVPVAYRIYPNQVHGFATFHFLPAAAACFDATLRDMAHVFASEGPSLSPLSPRTASERKLLRGASQTGLVPYRKGKYAQGTRVIVDGIGVGVVFQQRALDGVYEVRFEFGLAYVPLESKLSLA